jgi:hypothetical protein
LLLSFFAAALAPTLLPGVAARAVLLGAGDYPYAREADAGAVVSYQLRVPLRLHGGYAQDFLRRSGESVVRSSYVAAVIEGGATEETGTLGDIFLGWVNFTRAIVFVMFDEPSLCLGCEGDFTDATGAACWIAGDVYF